MMYFLSYLNQQHRFLYAFHNLSQRKLPKVILLVSQFIFNSLINSSLLEKTAGNSAPSATLAAPVRVAIDIIKSGFLYLPQ